MSFRLNLEQDKIQHLGAPFPLCATRDESVGDVIGRMQTKKNATAVICNGKVPIGIFTERDALRWMAAGNDFSVPIEEAMTPDPATRTVACSVGDAVRTMSEGGYRRLPIVDDKGELVALLRVSHILHFLVEHFPEYIYNLPPTPHHTMTQREGA